MGTRDELHSKLLTFCPNVYFQAPSNITLKYPCIVYSKSDKSKEFANDSVYKNIQGYTVMVIDRNPLSTIADNIEDSFQYCSINQYFTVENLNHTSLKLYF